MSRLFIIIIFAYLLSSCSSPTSSITGESTTIEKGKKRNVEQEESLASQESLGIATWRDISRSESKVSIADGEKDVRFRKGLISLDNPAIYAEILVFKQGTIFFKRDENQASIPPIDNDKQWEDELKKIAAKNEQLKSLKLNNFKQHKEEQALIVSATGEVNNKHCIVFFKALMDKSDDTKSKEMGDIDNQKKSKLVERATGVFCFPKKEGQIASKNEKVLSIAKQLTFDEGSHAQAHTLAQLTRSLDDYWKQQDSEAPKVEILKGSFDKNKKLIFVRGTATDNSNKIGFIKVNGQRLIATDFDRVIDSKGNFSIYVKSEREFKFSKATITIGDQYGNSTTKELEEGSVIADGTPIVFKKMGTGKTYVLLAGVGNYKIPKLLKPLNSPTYDINLLRSTLISTIGVPESQIITLKNPKKKEFVDALEDIRKDKLSYGDQLIVYFSGHGAVNDETQSGYWAFSDTTTSPETWLANVELKNRLSGFSDGGIMLIADSCFSGSIIADDFSIGVKTKDIDLNSSTLARTALTSAGNNPVPDTGNQLNSAFALAVTNALKHWINNSKLKAKSIMPGFLVYAKTKQDLAKSNQRTPHYGSFYKSDIKKDFVIKTN